MTFTEQHLSWMRQARGDAANEIAKRLPPEDREIVVPDGSGGVKRIPNRMIEAHSCGFTEGWGQCIATLRLHGVIK